MKKLNRILLIFAVISLFGLLITIGLHEYHYSFDPYSWLKSGKEGVESRNLWNERKSLYRYWILAFFVSSMIFGTLPTFSWFNKRRELGLK